MKVVYIAHPISGEVSKNINKIASIVRQINKTEPHIVPFVPYLVDCIALKDHIPDERKRGITNSIELFNRRFIDELWLYGDKISDGMWGEIELCQSLGIRVVPQTPQTHKAFYKLGKLRSIIKNIFKKDNHELQ